MKEELKTLCESIAVNTQEKKMHDALMLLIQGPNFVQEFSPSREIKKVRIAGIQRGHLQVLCCQAITSLVESNQLQSACEIVQGWASKGEMKQTLAFLAQYVENLD